MRDGLAAPPEMKPSPVPAAASGSSFPTVVGGLIGRTAAARRLGDLLSAYRVVTLVGPGGIGKTALGIEVARGMLTRFEDGGWFVELASLTDPDLVPSAVAEVFGFSLVSGTISAEAVARGIAGRNVLLFLDNCEHVIKAAAELVETIVRFFVSGRPYS